MNLNKAKHLHFRKSALYLHRQQRTTPLPHTMTTTITKKNRAVVINQNNGLVWANLYVNVRQGIDRADITLLRWNGKTLEGAKRWAEKQLGA